MICIKTLNSKKLSPLFSSHQFGRITLEAILSGEWGEVFTDNIENPQYVLLRLGGAHFVGGTPKKLSFENIVPLIIPGKSIFLPDSIWISEFKKNLGNDLISFKRTSFSAENLSLERIKELKKQIEPSLVLKQIDQELVRKIDEDLTKSLLKSYSLSDQFMDNVIGFCVVEKNKVVSAAFSYTMSNNRIEIQVNTISNHRRRGLATLASAALIEYCLENNLEPHWDSANKISFDLALKLGYSNPNQYTAYYIRPPN